MQDGNTDDFIFGIAHVVSYLSQFMTLLPGDVISTGTPTWRWLDGLVNNAGLNDGVGLEN